MTFLFQKLSLLTLSTASIIGSLWLGSGAIAQTHTGTDNEQPPYAQTLPLPSDASAQVNPPAESQLESGFETEVRLNPPIPHSAYVLDTGDQIAISVFGYDEFTGTWIVLPDGTINLPLLGSIIVSGQTPETLAQFLTQRLDEHLVDPVVTVSPSILRPVVVNVAGEVHRPGPLQLRSLSAVNPTFAATVNSRAPSTLDAVPTLSSALLEAGGITLNADIRSVVVTRSRPGQEPLSTTINLWNSIWSADVPDELMLQDGDSIFVPTLENNTDINQRLLVRSNFAPDTIAVRVMGEVKRPGEVSLSPTSSISGAIAAAGGHTTDGRLRHVALVRLNPDGSIYQEELDLRDLNDEGQVQEGDVIYVPQQNSSGILDFAGRVLSPINTMLNFLRFIE